MTGPVDSEHVDPQELPIDGDPGGPPILNDAEPAPLEVVHVVGHGVGLMPEHRDRAGEQELADPVHAARLEHVVDAALVDPVGEPWVLLAARAEDRREVVDAVGLELAEQAAHAVAVRHVEVVPG